MNGSAVRYWLILAVTLAAVYGSLVAWRMRSPGDEHALPDSSPMAAAVSDGPVQDFVLTDQDGAKFDSASLHGQVWVGSFFFTNCPGTCFRLNQTLADLQQSGPTSQIRYVSITCDPDNDTPEALKKYAEHFHADPARWTFLTGKLAELRHIGTDVFHVGFDKQTHSDRAFVIDRQGKLRGSFRLTQPDHVERLKKLIAVVEAEQPAESETKRS